MSTRPLYIFDLDGTLALIQHRRHFVENKQNRWDEFFDACDKDTPNVNVIKTFLELRRAGCEIWIWSGRSDSCYDKSRAWLIKNGIVPDDFKMRKSGDYTPDDALKLQWMMQIDEEDFNRLVAIFDDRDRVVKMWREQGITCFQVAPGDF